MAAGDPTLDDLVKKLEEEKQAQDAAQVDKNLADIRRLKTEVDKALPEYEAAYGGPTGLKAVQHDLERRQDEVRERLKSDLGEDGVKNVTEKVREVVDRLDGLKAALITAQAELEVEKGKHLAAEKALAEKTAALERWRKPAAAIGARQKAAAVIATEVERLATPATHESRQAYFLLGEGFAPKDPAAPTYGEAALAAARTSLVTAVASPPPLVVPAELAGVIVAAWAAFTSARQDLELAKLLVAEKETEVKVKATALAAAEKSLLDDINAALAGWSHDAAPTCGEKERADA